MYNPKHSTEELSEKLNKILVDGEKAKLVKEVLEGQLRNHEKQLIEELINFNYQNIDNRQANVIQSEVKMVRKILEVLETKINAGELAARQLQKF